MLNWWLGKPDAAAVHDGDTEIEAPETPAPVFAARALRSAFFGTPAPSKDDISSLHGTKQTGESTITNKKAQTINVSPMKPTGILLTPGTATSRRKTVSFGHEVVDKELVAVKHGRRSSENLHSGHSSLSRSTSLTQALENARSVSSTEEKANISNGIEEIQSCKRQGRTPVIEKATTKTDNQNVAKPGTFDDRVDDDFDGDMTMDLNEPHSQSGRFWKSEFENYHEEAREEMKKLLQYKQKAKSYAKMKDAEVLELTQKLREEQRRVSRMEDKIARLTTRPTRPGRNGYDADEDSPALAKELAKQTALAAGYKKQIDQMQSKSHGPALLTGPISTGHEEKVEEKNTSTHVKMLRDEIVRLQADLKATQRENTKLQESNKRLIRDLSDSEARVERLTGKSEQRRISYEDMRRKKDEALDQLQKTYDNLKDQARTQRKDAEELLTKRQSQIAELKRDGMSKQELENKVKELQAAVLQKTTEHSQAVAEYEIQLAELKRDVVLGTDVGIDLRASIQHDPALADSLAKHKALNESPMRFRESQIPIASQSISRPAAAAERRYRSETPTSSPPKRFSQPLSDVLNNASPNTIPPYQSGPVQFTPMTHHFVDISSPAPEFDLPSAEPSLIGDQFDAAQETRARPSPRPTMVHVSSSPPKPIRTRSQQLFDVKPTVEDKNIMMGSSRISNLEESRVRRAVPPERAAAAKARLEQRLAAKKKAQEMAMTGKENIPY